MNGKKGSDELIGGPGADSFVFDTRLGGGNIDNLDFVAGVDVIKLDNDIFAKLAQGRSFGEGLLRGFQADDATDRIGYDPSTGALVYDKNGDKPGGTVQFAWLETGLSLSAADFLVIG